MSGQLSEHDLMTVREVSAILRIDDTTCRRWIKAGVLDAVTLPHANTRQAYRVKRATVDALLSQGSAVAA